MADKFRVYTSNPSPAAKLLKRLARFPLALVIVLAVGLASLSRKPAPPGPDLVLEHSLALLARGSEAQQPATDWQKDGTAYGKAGVLPEVRRAERVPTSVKRATLLRLPGQEFGVYKWYDLPAEWGGGSVWARYVGTKERFSEIPPNPSLGDLWNVTETGASWIYCIPAGYDHAAWIDP
jgi:hypothetical protein